MRRVTVLGSCGAWPTANRAASGFLIEYEGFRLVLDLGYATLPRLLSICSGDEIDAVVITHEHPDHCVDLSALYRERRFAPGGKSRVALYCPPGVVQRISQLEPSGDLGDVFDIHDVPGHHDVGPFHLAAVPLPHFVPNAGLRLVAPDLVLAYTGDSGPDPALATLGADADLYIVEATHQGEPPREGVRYLKTAGQAGQWAARAGARHLLLTHFWPGIDREISVHEARLVFSGQITAADEGIRIEL